jgi:hypothetical protein
MALDLLQGLLDVTLELFLSAFARSGFQVVQFLLAVVLPHVLLAAGSLTLPRMEA